MLAALRALAWITVLALLLDAPAAPRRAVPPIAALDASASWLRGGDSARWRRAIRRRGARPRELLLFGDSVRPASPPVPRDVDDARASRSPSARSAVGRPLVLVTDGELDDPAPLASLPAGSRVEVLAHTPARSMRR